MSETETERLRQRTAERKSTPKRKKGLQTRPNQTENKVSSSGLSLSHLTTTPKLMMYKMSFIELANEGERLCKSGDCSQVRNERQTTTIENNLI